jgi:hypothetical protein
VELSLRTREAVDFEERLAAIEQRLADNPRNGRPPDLAWLERGERDVRHQKRLARLESIAWVDATEPQTAPDSRTWLEVLDMLLRVVPQEQWSEVATAPLDPGHVAARCAARTMERSGYRTSSRGRRTAAGLCQIRNDC